MVEVAHARADERRDPNEWLAEDSFWRVAAAEYPLLKRVHRAAAVLSVLSWILCCVDTPLQWSELVVPYALVIVAWSIVLASGLWIGAPRREARLPRRVLFAAPAFIAYALGLSLLVIAVVPGDLMYELFEESPFRGLFTLAAVIGAVLLFLLRRGFAMFVARYSGYLAMLFIGVFSVILAKTCLNAEWRTRGHDTVMYVGSFAALVLLTSPGISLTEYLHKSSQASECDR